MRNLIKKVAILILALSILVVPEIQVSASQDTKTNFKDVKSTSWYYIYVTKLVELKITAGIGNNMFAPNQSVTRAEFVTFLCNVKGYKQTQGNPFVDCQKSWAIGFITAALANGIIDLPNDKKFRPNDAVTRQEVAEMMCRAVNITPDNTTNSPYADVTSNTGYPTAAYSNYLMQGSVEKNGRYFYPQTKITRGEVAAVIVNAYDYNLDKIAYLNTKLSEEEKKKREAEKYQVWLNSIEKGVSKELLNNTTDLTGGKTVQECNEYATKELEKFEYWMKDCNFTNVEDFKEEFVSVAKNFTNLYYNRNYKKLDVLEKGLKEQWASIKVENYLDDVLTDTKTNKVVKEGEFFTGTGLFLMDVGPTPKIRGTLKYRYLSPTDKKMFSSDICSTTGKPCQYDTWYEVDLEVTFIPEKGLKVSTIEEISKIRLAR